MDSSRLFQPLQIGATKLSHRLVMAPLTRFRASDSHVPLPMVKEYYAQRASEPGTLLITEATFITNQAGGSSNIPGIWSQEQIEAWREVTSAVHEKKSFIFLQLWALGRAANPDVLRKEGEWDLVSSSDVPIVDGGPAPRPLSKDEISQYVDDYVKAARNAIAAGFDGVELHGANGYLIDQFLQDNSNKRTDEYGGSIENRSRFCLEVAQATVAAIGAERVGIRLSPFSTFQGMKMDDPVPQFTHVVTHLRPLKLAYIHAVESRIAGNQDIESTSSLDFVIEAWGDTSPVLLAGGFTAQKALDAVDKQYKNHDVGVVFGRYFISNPDLPFRIKKGIQFNKYNRDTFYNAKSEIGYTDYQFSQEFEAVRS